MTRSCFRFWNLIPCMLFTMAPTVVVAAPTPFVVEVVGDTSADSNLSLALDDDGNPRVSYRDISDQGFLRFAEKNEGAWSIETVLQVGEEGGEPSLALDSQGNPHIAFHDGLSAPDSNRLAVRDGAGIWSFETIDFGGGPQLALDPLGIPQVAYRTQTEIRWARRDGGAWTIEVVDSTGSVRAPSLALNAIGEPRIAYFDQTSNILRFARKRTNLWDVEDVDLSLIAVFELALALDA